MKISDAQLSICLGNREECYNFTGPQFSNRMFSITHSQGQLQNGRLVSLQLEAQKPLRLTSFSMTLEPDIDPAARMLVNGYQTWTQTREVTGNQRLGRLFFPARPLLAPYGDYHFVKPRGRGRFHSWSWVGFNNEGNWLLVGSCDESAGFTKFTYDYHTRKLMISCDCQGLRSQGATLLKLYIGRGEEQTIWDEYSSLLPPAHRRLNPKTIGWTSWYNYYTKIDQGIIRQNLRALSESGLPLDVFQIDDGWQQKIGDWLHVNHKFPAGMDTLAREIRATGLRPGLWLAPFICEKNSELWKKNYDWVLKDRQGRPVRAGWNPGWSGWFYALDFYAPGFQTWLREVFRTVFKDWGYQLVKLDFLYAVSLHPHHNKSRGQIMCEAMDFLDNICGENKILACGVPLGAAAGKVDYCRIGSDVAPYWEDKFLASINYRERVSTVNSLLSTLHRQMLDRRFFRNDPDVFILRDGKLAINENKLTPDQRYTLFLVNNLLGGLVFFSEDITSYTPEQRELLSEMFPALETTVTRFENSNNLYTVHFQAGEDQYIALVNLNDSAESITLPEGAWFHPEYFVCRQKIKLRPHQSICLRRLAPHPDRPWLLGSSGHLWPGAQVKPLEPTVDGWRLELVAHAAPHTRVWLGTADSQPVIINGEEYTPATRDGYNYIIV
ncbi:MAG: alpha-galactosidase [Firmicutes bacterium]|nr:alpha-galactosidase [Bacillota bacterium]